jgi:Bax protein
MIGQTFRRVTFERFAIALTGFCVAFLYLLVVLDYSRTGSPAAADMPDAPPQAAALPVEPLILPPAAEPVPAPRTQATPETLLKPVQVYTIASGDKVTDVFGRIGYHLDTVRMHGEVPRVFFASLPEDLTSIRVPAKRKAIFIQTTLPLILHVNELILHDRARIKELRASKAAGAPLSAADRSWLEAKAEEYGLEEVDFARLLRRVDVIPPSLALAQSAEESGWGTSRFAQQGNALFGQRVWSSHKKGIVPHGRPEGERFRVRAFDHLIDGVKSYARNLNMHGAYREFRNARAAQRRAGAGVDGYDLAETLHRYSERGADYVAALRTIIRVNGLTFFDDVRLGDRLSQGAEEEAALHDPPDA